MIEFEKGQTLLIVVLVMVVSLTVGLSVATRAINNIRVATEDEDSKRAFSAAEAGIELALNDAEGAGTLSNSAIYESTVSKLEGSEFLLNNGSAVLKDSTVDLWLSSFPDYSSPTSANVTFYWGSDGDVCDSIASVNTSPAVEIVVIAGSKSAPILTHHVFDSCSGRRLNNNFDIPDVSADTISGREFAYKKTINITQGLLARIIPLYAPTSFAISSDTDLPSQGDVITSIGTSDQTQRKIISFRGYPKLPTELFPFILFLP